MTSIYNRRDMAGLVPCDPYPMLRMVSGCSFNPPRAMAARALSMLEAGITTAPDLGGPDGSELVLRDRIAAG